MKIYYRVYHYQDDETIKIFTKEEKAIEFVKKYNAEMNEDTRRCCGEVDESELVSLDPTADDFYYYVGLEVIYNDRY